jgi:hypothetical protein
VTSDRSKSMKPSKGGGAHDTGGRVGVYAHVIEVVTEALLEQCLHTGIEGCPGWPEHPRQDVGCRRDRNGRPG